jgi:hypothetical protein
MGMFGIQDLGEGVFPITAGEKSPAVYRTIHGRVDNAG